jgi:two-component system response regulator HydG
LQQADAMPRVLVVDDDPSYLMILDALCRGCGAEVVTAATASEARAALAGGSFDLLLLDLQLARQEGLPLIAEIEQSPELASRAVVVTGFAMFAPAFTTLPVVDKGSLEYLGAYLRNALGAVTDAR